MLKVPGRSAGNVKPHEALEIVGVGEKVNMGLMPGKG